MAKKRLSNELDYYQKLIYVYLKKFANTKSQCYPSVKTISKQSGISIPKVKKVLKELEEKGIIVTMNRIRPDGGKSSNLYTLYDTADIWIAENVEESKVAIEKSEIDRSIKILTAAGYEVIEKEKEPACDPTKEHTQAPNLNKLVTINTTTDSDKSQVAERYSIGQIHE